MSGMKALYEKVAGNSVLQARFGQILIQSEQAGKEATEEKLAAFAKEQGFDLSLSEMTEFFQSLSNKEQGELSDLELDLVAGGKSLGGMVNIAQSVLTVGFGCIAQSALVLMSEPKATCNEFYQ